MTQQKSIDVYTPGADVTGRATAAVKQSRFVAITGNAVERLVQVAHAAAGGRTAGVAKYDAATGELVGIARGKDRIVYVTAGANLTAFGEVQVGADGKAVPFTTGVKVGYATTAATTDTAAAISLA